MHLPINLNVKDRLCVVIGGGPVALRKSITLSDSGARIRVVSPVFTPAPEWDWIHAELIVDQYKREHLDGAFLAVAATNHPEVNSEVARDATARGILQQQVDKPTESDFTLPATLKHGDFTVSFATGGAIPALSAILRERADAHYDEAFGRLCRLVTDLKQQQPWRNLSARQRQEGLKRIARSEVIDLLRADHLKQATLLASSLLFEDEAYAPDFPGENTVPVGKVYLVGAGPGDTGLITVRGSRCLRAADFVLFDTIVNTELLDLYCPQAEWVNVGKRKGHVFCSQEKTNEMMVDLARMGLTVVRLKGGDPLIFGRGGEEARHLSAAGIPFEIVPGVTSISAVPAYAGIPVTDRDFAMSMGIYSMHKKGSFNPDDKEWASMATGPDTLVLLMGITAIDRVAEKLVAFGRPGSTPAAVVINGTREGQVRIVGTLETIAAQVQQEAPDGPGLIIVGEAITAIESMDWFPAHYTPSIATRPKPTVGQDLS